MAHGPTSCEGLDSRLVDVLRARRGPDAVPPLPRGGAWLFVELGRRRRRRGARPRAALVAADGIAAGRPRRRRTRPPGAGCGGSARTARAWPGAAPSDRPALARLGGRRRPAGAAGRLPRAVRRARRSYEHGLPPRSATSATAACTYGSTSRSTARTARRFRAVPHRRRRGWSAEFGGSLSGEHGDGRARCELLPHMYSPDAIALFGGVKHAFDPGNLLNPGVLVDPDPVDADMRPAGRFPLRRSSPWPTRTTTATSPRPCTAAPASASAAPTTPQPAASCAPPTWPPARRRTPPAAAPGCCRRSCAASFALVATRRCTTRWTCACPARAAPPTARPASTWPPTSPRCCTRPTGAGCARARTTRWAAAALGPAGRPDAAAGERRCAAARSSPARAGLAGVDTRRRVPAFAAAPVPRARFAPVGRRATASRWCCSPTRSPTRSHPRSPRPPYGCCAPPATSRGCRRAPVAAA